MANNSVENSEIITKPRENNYDLRRAAFLQNKFFVFLGSTSITAIGYNYFLRTFTGELYYFIPFISSIPMNWMTSFVLTVLFTVLLCLLSRKKLFKIPLCGKFS